MSIIDIIRGDVPLLKPTMRSRIRSIEQDYARLASKGGERRYITDSCSDYKREQGALVDALEIPPDAISQEYVDAMLQDRRGIGSGIDATFFQAPNIIGGAFLGTDWKFDIPVSLPDRKYKICYLINSVRGWGGGAVGLQAGISFQQQFPGRLPPQAGGPAGSPLVGIEQLFPLVTSDGSVPRKVFVEFTKGFPSTMYLTYGPTSGGSATDAFVFLLCFTNDIKVWRGNMDSPGA